MEIQVVDNNVEKAIRVLKRKLQQEGLFREMKQRKFYEKPSVKRKRKEKEAQRRRSGFFFFLKDGKSGPY